MPSDTKSAVNSRKMPIGATWEEPTLTVPPYMPSMGKINAKKKKYTAFSFFSGTGGSSTGLKMAGFAVLYANEFVPNALHNYRLNAPDTVVDKRDIRKVRGPELLKKFGLKRGQLDLLEGSPPCKAFSHAQARKGGDDFGKVIPYSEGVKQRVDDLFFEQIRLIEYLKPRTISLENVDGLARHVNRGILIEVIEKLEDAGYVVEARILDGAFLGVPQHRRRLIIVGVRKDIVKKLGVHPVFPKPNKREATVAEHLPHIVKIRTPRGFESANQAYGTITASDHSIGYTALFSNGAWVETKDGTRRRFTIGELKRMFSFPDDFKLEGSFIQQFERLGRSHLPMQMYRVASMIAKEILEPWHEYLESR